MSSGDPHPSDLFDKLWGQLRESHRNALQEAEDKVSKLKTARYLDAESLQAFHSRTQKLKEENKTLQDTIIGLEERLCTRKCDRCAVLEENLKNNQDQNLHLIAKLKNERESLEDENRQLHAELQKIKISRLELQQASTSEQEDGIIPDSPILMSSLPVPNKLRKQKDVDKRKHVRYAEMPLPCKSLFSALDTQPVDATKNPGRPQVLVPDTCVLDSSQVLNDVNPNPDEAIAETCGLELGDQPHAKTTAGQQKILQSSWKHGFRLKPYHLSPSPSALSRSTATEKSPSLLQSVKRFSEDGSNNKAKRKKEESEPEVQEEDKRGIQEGVDKQNEGRKIQPQLIKQSSTLLASPLRKQCLVTPNGVKDPSAQNRTLSQKPNVSCIIPVFKKPDVKAESIACFFRKKGNPQDDPNASRDQHEGKDAGRRPKVEPTWSIDPALALSMYDSEWRGDEQKEKEEGCDDDDDDDEEECHGELLDSDRTWVSHSLLPCRGEAARDQRDGVSGLGEKANDSLDMMFDTTAHGEYQSCNNSHLDHNQPGDDDDDDDDGEEDNDQHAQEKTMNKGFGHKAGRPAFAHMAVVRKKDERRKLKGATCKECELYYAHLTEEERQVKLSACSRHRFLYVPPSTPENFWEVGFPSTQTCIERGYIKEEKKPQARSRRRQPFNALFSQKQKQQQS